MTLTSLTFANGSLNVYSPLSVDYLVLSGGTINNNSYAATSMTLNGWSDGKSGLWSGGTINLATSLTNSGTFTLGSSPPGSGDLSLGGTAALINQGNIIQTGTYNLVLDSFSHLDNQGSYTFQGDGNITSASTTSGAGYPGIVTNSGTITKADGTGKTLISTVINNNRGTLDVEKGTLTLQPLTALGNYSTFTGGTFKVVAADAVLDLTGGFDGHFYYTGTYHGSGDGTVSLNSGTLGIGSDGAIFDFQKAGLFQWSGGTIDAGAGNLTNAGSLTLTGSGIQELQGSNTGNALINQGDIVQAGPSNLTLTIGAALDNQGSYTFQDNGTISATNPYGYPGIVTNSGALSGNGTIATNVDNTGQVNPGGAGTAGVIAITGNYTQGDSGALNIDIGGIGSDQFDRLTVSGAATLGGTISARLLNNFTPAAGQTFQDVIDFASKSGDFTTQDLSLGNYLILQEQFDPSTNPVRLNLIVNQVIQAPTITANPTNQIANAGQTATFTAAASGNPTPTVQWQMSTDGGKTFSDIPGATIATYSFTTTAAENGNEYQAVFTNTAGKATTTAATLTVDYAPAVTSNPTSLTVNAGQTATFMASASDGNPTPTTVQWQVSTDGGKSFSDIAGATGTTLSFTATAAQNGTEYQAVFSNAAGLSATTTAATLTVDFAPTVTSSPTNQTVNAGQTATFMASASDGNPTPTTVQWQVSTDGGSMFSDIAGATSTKLTLTNTTPAQNGSEYEAVFSNSAGLSATTTPATLTVDYAPTVTNNPTNLTINAGQTATFMASASDGNPTPTAVQWQVNTGSGFTNLSNAGVYSGVTTDTLTITGVTAGLNGAQYWAVFSNTAGLAPPPAPPP